MKTIVSLYCNGFPAEQTYLHEECFSHLTFDKLVYHYRIQDFQYTIKNRIIGYIFLNVEYKKLSAVRLFNFVDLQLRRSPTPKCKKTLADAAERQAVNTTVQGSAADIAKAAMCAIDNKTSSINPKPRLLLQMHDELIYEVQENHEQTFIKIMKQVMEKTVKLNVPLPVKVKCGYSWGTLKEVKF